MIAIAFYLLKVIICSGILYGYYHLALKDKVFHQWNRFYLLSIVPLSILLPFLNLHIVAPATDGSSMVTVMQIVAGADEYVAERQAPMNPSIALSSILWLLYIAGSAAVGAVFAKALVSIRKMIRRNQQVNMGDFTFLNTREPGTPFSYFRYLLWNQEIPLDSENGRRILDHELIHIREHHSRDKLFIQCVLVVGWMNPFFWLIRRELGLIHEFIADHKTVGRGNAQALAKLLLETSFPGYAPMMTNPFFTSSIKRRIAMMTKKQHPALNYLSRLMMIPVLFVLLFAFGVKAETFLNENQPTIHLDKPVTVVIDAGHGGTDDGAMFENVSEKNITLAFAQVIKRLNNNPNLKLVFTRESDVFHNVKEKTAVSQEYKADLFISVHINASPSTERSGIEAVVSNKMDNPFFQQNLRIASLLLKNVATVYKTEQSIKNREKGVYVLDKNFCPSVIIEMGYLTNPTDLQFVTNPTNQEKLARQVLRSIEEYFSPSVQVISDQSSIHVNDTLPKNKQIKKVTFVYSDGTQETLTPEEYQKKMGRSDIAFTSDTIIVNGKSLQALKIKKMDLQDADYFINGKAAAKSDIDVLSTAQIDSMRVLKQAGSGRQRVDIYIKDAKMYKGEFNGIVKVNEGKLDSMNLIVRGTLGSKGIIILNEDPLKPNPLYIVNGKEISIEELKGLDPNDIESIDILKGKSAEAIYREKGKNGVVIITMKK